jgi:hypothetical protein
MPILAYAGGMWYGSASGAMVDTLPVTSLEADIKADKRLASSIQAGQIEPYIKGTMGRKQTLSVQGMGELALAEWKKRGRIALSVSIGSVPSAFDIAQAVWLQQASSINVSGSTGEKINSAGSAGNPWTDTTNYPAGSKGALLKQAADSAELASIT